MAKRILLAIVLIIGALIAYNYVTTGHFALIPTRTLSEEEQELNGLEERIRQSVKQFAQAGRAAGLSGVDTTADAEKARLELEKVGRRLVELQRKASDKARVEIQKLQGKLEDAKREMGVR